MYPFMFRSRDMMEVTTVGSLFPSPDIASTLSGDMAVGNNTTNVADFNIRTAYLSIGLLGMLGNFVVVLVMICSPTLRRKSTNILILNQSLIDFCAAFFVIAHDMIRILPSSADRMTQDIYCRLWKARLPMWGLFISSTYNLIAMTLDRYVALVHPLVHRNRCSRKKIYIIMAAVWLFGPGWQSSYVIPTSGLSESGKCTIVKMYPSPQIQRFVGILAAMLEYFIPLLIITFAYTRMAIVLRRGVNTRSGNNVISDTREQRMLKASTKVVKTLLAISLSFIVCWSPNQIFYTMYNCGVKVDFKSTFYHFSVVLAFLNCCVNPLIYSLRYEEFQRELGRQLRCRKSLNRSASDVSCHRTSVPRLETTDMSNVPSTASQSIVGATAMENREVISAMKTDVQSQMQATGPIETGKQSQMQATGAIETGKQSQMQAIGALETGTQSQMQAIGAIETGGKQSQMEVIGAALPDNQSDMQVIGALETETRSEMKITGTVERDKNSEMQAVIAMETQNRLGMQAKGTIETEKHSRIQVVGAVETDNQLKKQVIDAMKTEMQPHTQTLCTHL